VAQMIKTMFKKIHRNQIQINISKSVLEITQISSHSRDHQLMMVSERYLRKKQRMIIKSGVNLVTVKAVIKTKNKRSCLKRNLILMSLKKVLKKDKQKKAKNKISNSLLTTLMIKWI
jgi:hypothetical protein